MFATANTLHVSAFLIDPVFFLLTCNLITMQNLVVVSHITCVHIRGPENFGYARAMPPRDEGMVDPL